MAEIIDDGSQPQQHLPNVSVIFGQRGADLYADRPEQGDRSVVGSTAGGVSWIRYDRRSSGFGSRATCPRDSNRLI